MRFVEIAKVKMSNCLDGYVSYGRKHKILWYHFRDIYTDIQLKDYFGSDVPTNSHSNKIGRKYLDENAWEWTAKKFISLYVFVDDTKMAGKNKLLVLCVGFVVEKRCF